MSDRSDQAGKWMAKIRSYRRVFLGDDQDLSSDASLVMDDLRRFCHADATTHCFDATDRSDPLATAQLEGRRQVWLRIKGFIHIGEGEMSAIGQSMGGDDE